MRQQAAFPCGTLHLASKGIYKFMRFLYIIDSTKKTLVAMSGGVASRQCQEDDRRASASFGRQELPEEEKAKPDCVPGTHGFCGFGARNHRTKNSGPRRCRKRGTSFIKRTVLSRLYSISGRSPFCLPIDTAWAKAGGNAIRAAQRTVSSAGITRRPRRCVGRLVWRHGLVD